MFSKKKNVDKPLQCLVLWKFNIIYYTICGNIMIYIIQKLVLT